MSPRAELGLLALAVLVSTACGPDEDPLAGLTVVGEDPSDAPLPDLTEAQMARFDEGDALFEAVFREAQGLGPLYIRHSCASCHAQDARGPGAVRKMVIVDDDGVTPSADQSALPWGHTVRTQLSADATVPLEPPDGTDGLLVTQRFGPAVFGRGFIEAIEDAEIQRVEAEQAMRTDGISGRINRVPWQSEQNADQPYHTYGPGSVDLIGRFGLKARVATLDEFTADAYQGDMGITSPMRPTEPENPEGLTDDALAGLDIDRGTVNAVADYVRLLDIPERRLPAGRGESLFEQALCSVCHVPSMRTRGDYPIPQIAGTAAAVYTDLLLHQMGSDAADGLEEFGASSSEWQTPPLMGLRHLRNYMHDGGAETIEEAIRAHEGPGSEANGSIEAFDALSEGERQELADWVSAL